MWISLKVTVLSTFSLVPINEYWIWIYPFWLFKRKKEAFRLLVNYHQGSSVFENDQNKLIKFSIIPAMTRYNMPVIFYITYRTLMTSTSKSGHFWPWKRLLRVFRLAQMWVTMRKLLSIISTAIMDVGYLTIVLFIVLYIFAVIGKYLTGMVSGVVSSVVFGE